MRNLWAFLSGERFWEWATLHPKFAYRILILTIVCTTVYSLARLLVDR